MIFWISSVSVFMSPFSFLILLIQILSLYPLVSLAKGLSILLFFFFKEPAPGLIDSLYSSFVCAWLISSLSLIISYCLLLLCVFASLHSRGFSCAIKLLLYFLSSFFVEVRRAMCFPLSTAFIVSPKFGYVVPSFSLNSKESLFVVVVVLVLSRQCFSV